ncbi:DUF481 domain-containing protein [bacterium]|nr:DUF481 domain-containing protein [bacterium]
MNNQGGNTVLSDTQYGFRTDYLGNQFRCALELNYEYGSAGGALYANNGAALFRYIGSNPSPWNWETVISQEYDVMQSLVGRFNIGAGLRMNIVGAAASGGNNLAYGVGALYETQTFTGVPTTQSIRLVNYLSWGWTFTSSTSLTGVVRSLNNTNNLSDYRSSVSCTLTTQLTNQIALTTQYQLDYTTNPASGALPLDTQLTNGLTVSF